VEGRATVLVSDEGAAQVLGEAGHRVICAADGQDVLDRLQDDRPDVVVMDAQLRGLEACRAIKRRGRPELLPVVLITSARAEAFRAGADDVLARPLDPEELCARVAVWLRTRRLFETGRTGPAEKDVGGTDRLTGLPDQRAFTQRLGEEFTRAERDQAPLSVMAVDLDRLDQVNSRFGRGAGDRLLVACARALARACRDGDLVARAGGDELVALLPGLHFAGSLAIAEKAWRELHATVIVDAGARITGAASVGVASYPSRDIESPTDLLRFAHSALARAKAEGQGRICLYQHQGYLFQPEPAP
jgi:diguanylate cyclase (GGDEF)-like protein